MSGVVELDLRSLIPPAKTPEKCSMEMMERGPDKSKSQQAQSLLAQKSVRGWWPCTIDKDGKKELGVSTEGVVWLFTVHDGKSVKSDR